jgi:hypothetical protein
MRSIFDSYVSSKGLAFLAFWKRATESAAPIKKSAMNRRLPPVKKAPAKNVNATRNKRTAKPCVEFDSMVTSKEMILLALFGKAAQHLCGHETSRKAQVGQDPVSPGPGPHGPGHGLVTTWSSCYWLTSYYQWSMRMCQLLAGTNNPCANALRSWRKATKQAFRPG